MKWLVALAVVSSAAPVSAKTVAYAIDIGVNTPPVGHDLAPLRFADDDAVRMQRFFGRFARTYLLSVLDDETQRRFPDEAAQSRAPSLAELRRVVSDIAKRMNADLERGDIPVLYFSYSGHGSADAQGHYVLALGPDLLDRQVLYSEVVARTPARFHHLMIDACHAEAIAGARGMFDNAKTGTLAAVTAEEQRSLEDREQRFASVGTLLAASRDEQAHEWSRIQSGLFTHELLSAFSGAADANHDGHVDYAEVRAFMAAANRMVKDPRATPSIRINAPALDHSASLVEQAALAHTGFLFGTPGKLGHFYVEAANGERLLDAHFDAPSEAEISLPAGETLFLRTADQEARFVLQVGQRQDFSRCVCPKEKWRRAARSTTPINAVSSRFPLAPPTSAASLTPKPRHWRSRAGSPLTSRHAGKRRSRCGRSREPARVQR